MPPAGVLPVGLSLLSALAHLCRSDSASIPPFPTTPSPARAWNYFLGGTDNFPATGPFLADARLPSRLTHSRAVRRLGEQDFLLLQFAERPRRQLLAAQLPPDEAGNQLARSPQAGCRHVTSKIVNSVAEWVSSRHLRRSNHNRFTYQSSGSGAAAGSATAGVEPRAGGPVLAQGRSITPRP